MIDFGNIDISEAHLGDIELDSIWLGSIKVWPDGTPPAPTGYTFSVSPSSISVASGASYNILTASGTTPHWEVNYYSDWITIDGITGNTIQVSVSNNTGDTRQGGITFIYVDSSAGTINSFTVSVTQEATSIVGNVITYVSINDSIVVPKNPTGFNANIVSNTYYPDDDYGEIVFDDDVTEIKGAFYQCTGLTEIVIPDTVSVIGVTSGQPVSTADGIFYGCTNLQKVVLSSNLVTLGRYSFTLCPLTSITLPDTLVEIGRYCFQQCTGLTQIVIPNSVTTVDSAIFYKCSSLSSVTLPENFSIVASNMFSDCTSLPSINIPNTVTSINSGAFDACSSLSSVTIGSGVTSIGLNAFRSCSSLYEFNYNGTKSQWSNITKNRNWKTGCPATVVHCTDGDVSI